MVLGLGLDIVEVRRIERILAGPKERVQRFLLRCFTEKERAYAETKEDRATRYAARFAAKEALSKALGAPAGIRFLDAEVVRTDAAPSLELHGVAQKRAGELGVARVWLSISHDGGVAAAVVVLEGP